MYEGMAVKVEVGAGATSAVCVRRGVLQGDPLPPLLFNLCINFILNDLNRVDLQRIFGFNVNDDLALSCFAFADNLVIVGKNRAALSVLVRRAMECLENIGLKTNAAKSNIVDIVYNGGERIVNDSQLDIGGGVFMPALSVEQSVVYLGVKFRNNLQFNLKEEMEEFGVKLQELHQYPFLHSDRNLPC